MNKIIKKYDERSNCIHYKNPNEEDIYEGDIYEEWYEYDSRNNVIHHKDSSGYEYWQEFNEDNRLIHTKNNGGREWWGKYENEKQIEITQQEFERIKEQEFLSREPVSIFELMDIE